MTTSDNVVTVRDLRKSYGGVTSLDGVSLDIRRGETFALLGPNGAGKSTTIEILEGYRDRTSGAEARVPVVRWRERGASHEQRTTELAALVAKLHAEHGGEPESLEVIRPGRPSAPARPRC